MLWFYSDPHFGHHRILKYADRPFLDDAVQTKELIRRYNARVGWDDTTLWLGDCFLCGKGIAKGIMHSLHGDKILLRGNHDGTITRMQDIGFSAVGDDLTMEIAGQQCFFRHRPIPEPGYVLIHGHTHSQSKVSVHGIHVGVDAWSYGPVSMEELEEQVGLFCELTKKR